MCILKIPLFSVRSPLKIAVQLRKEHGLESFVFIIDLVKAFDTINHQLMFLVLKRYGYPPRMIKIIKNMYMRFSLCFRKGKEKAMIEYLIGVYQSNNLSPPLLILVFQAATESLEHTEERAQRSCPTYRYFQILKMES